MSHDHPRRFISAGEIFLLELRNQESDTQGERSWFIAPTQGVHIYEDLARCVGKTFLRERAKEHDLGWQYRIVRFTRAEETQ
jgi:hypothetical protein